MTTTVIIISLTIRRTIMVNLVIRNLGARDQRDQGQPQKMMNNHIRRVGVLLIIRRTGL